MPNEDWQPIETAPHGKVIRLKGPAFQGNGATYETNGVFDGHHNAWCGTEAPHFRLPFGPGCQPTHWKSN